MLLCLQEGSVQVEAFSSTIVSQHFWPALNNNKDLSIHEVCYIGPCIHASIHPLVHSFMHLCIPSMHVFIHDLYVRQFADGPAADGSVCSAVQRAQEPEALEVAANLGLG